MNGQCLSTLTALEAMRWLLHLRIERDGPGVMLSVVLADIEAAAAATMADWDEAVSQAAAGRVVHPQDEDRGPDSTAFERSTPLGAGFPLLAAQALEATSTYFADFVGRADSEIVLPYGWTALELDGQTSDPAAWWDWLDAVFTVLVGGSEGA